MNTPLGLASDRAASANPSTGTDPPQRILAKEDLPRVGQFTTTHWSVVVTAGKRDLPEAAEALEKLCRAYWYPLYAYARRQGNSPEDAEDLTQQFFSRLLEKNYLAKADRDRGKFRTFLLGSMKNFLVNEWNERPD